MDALGAERERLRAQLQAAVAASAETPAVAAALAAAQQQVCTRVLLDDRPLPTFQAQGCTTLHRTFTSFAETMR